MNDDRLDAPARSPPSYDPEGLGRSFDRELARLRAQVAISWAVEQRRLAALGVADGQRVLEPGCGPGFFTQRLANWLSSSSITALDCDPRLLQVAHETLAGFGPRVSLANAPVESTGLPSHAFDLAVSRYLFQHLADPVAAAAEIRRVLRPGGVHIVIDVDDGAWGLSEPRIPEFQGWHYQRARAQAARGGDRFRGHRLSRILKAAGYRRVELDVFAYHSDDLGLQPFVAQIDPEQFLPLLDQGTLTLAEYIKAQALYEEFARCPDAFVLSIGFLAYAETPP